MNNTTTNFKSPSSKSVRDFSRGQTQTNTSRENKHVIKYALSSGKSRGLEEKIDKIISNQPQTQRFQLPALIGEFKEVFSPHHFVVSEEFLSPTEANSSKRPIRDLRSTQYGESPNYIPRASMTSKIKIWEKINELKQSLTKYQSTSDEVLFPTKGDIKKVISCIQLLNEDQEDNTLSELLSIIVKLLKMSIFVNPKLIRDNKKLIMSSKFADLERIAEYCPEETTPYYSLVLNFLKFLSVKDEGKERMIALPLENKIAELTHIIEERDTEIKNMKEKFSDIIPREEYDSKIFEIEDLNRKVDILQDSNRSQQENLKFLRDENNQIKNQYERQQAEVDKANLLVKYHESERQKALDLVEEYRGRVRATQNRMKEFKDTMDKILIKLSLLRQEVLDLRKKNEDLLAENERISIRAAVGFENLTPRPDFKKLSAEYDFELNLVDEKKRPASTVNAVGSMGKKIKELNQKIIDAANQEAANAAKLKAEGGQKKFVQRKNTSEMKSSTRTGIARPKMLKVNEDKDDNPLASYDEIMSPVSTMEKKDSKVKVDIPKLVVENKFGQDVLNKTKELVTEIKNAKYQLDNLQSDERDND